MTGLEGVRNFRQMGGLIGADGRQIRPDVLFRSGQLSGATEADLDRLAGYGLRTIIDLRTDADVASEGEDKAPAGARVHRVPMVDESGAVDSIRTIMMTGDDELIRETFGDGKAEKMGNQGAARFVTDPARCAQFSEAIGVLLSAERRPALWHCSAGKDRAGWMATAIALTLGVSREQAIEHYLASNQSYGVSAEAEKVLSGRGVLEHVRPLLEVQQSYIESSFAALDTTFGGIDGYLYDALSLDPKAVEAFRADILI